MASKVFLLVLYCSALAYATADLGLNAKLGNNHGDTVDILASWNKAVFCMGFRKYTLTYSLGNETSTPVTTDDLSLALQNLEFWTNYTLNLDTTCLTTESQSIVFFTGPGNPHEVSSVEAEPKAIEAKVTIKEADKLPHIPDQYELTYCIKGTKNCQTKTLPRNFELTAITDSIDKLIPLTTYELNTTAIIGAKPNEFRSVPFTIEFTTVDVVLPAPSNISAKFTPDQSNEVDTVFQWQVEANDEVTLMEFNFTISDNKNNVVKTGSSATVNSTVKSLPGESQLVFTVTAAYNVSGAKDLRYSNATSYSFKTPGGDPNPVSDIEYVALGDTSEYVTWRAPDNTSINQFNVTYCAWDVKKNNCSSNAIMKVTPVNSITLASLTANTQYNISVVVLNEYNQQSNATSVLATTNSKDYEAPSAVTSSNSKNETDNAEYTISWKMPIDFNATFFNVTTCFDDSCNDPQTTKDNKLAVNISYFVDYNVTVDACYNLKLHQTVCRSAAPFNGTSVGTNVSSVQDVSVSSYTDKTIELKWNAPKELPATASKDLSVSYIISDKNQGIEKSVSDLKVAFDNLTAYTDYTFTIDTWIVFHKENFSGLESNISTQTDSATPGATKSVSVVQQKLSTMITIEWVAPDVKNGPIDYYAINVTRAEDGNTVVNSVSYGSNRFTTALPSTNGDNYTVAVYAVNYDQNGKQLEGESAQHNITFMGIGKPKNATVVDYTSFELTIEVEAGADQNNTDVYFKFEDTKSDQVGYTTDGNTGKIGGLKPFSDQVINVRSCFSPTFCGDPIPVKGKTNVGPPSVVTNVNATYTNMTNPSVMWDKPTITNGPLDGYVVEVLQISEPGTKSVQFVLNTTQTSFTYNATDEWETYNLTVYGFNDDLRPEHKSETILGDKAIAQVTTNGDSAPKPKDISESNTTSSSSVIEWNAPEPDARFNITTYRVELTSEAKLGSVKDFFTGNTTITLDKLAAYDNFTVKISSCEEPTSETCGQARKFKFATDAAAPEAPTDVKMGKVTTKSLELKWSKPKQINGRLDGYRVKIVKSGKKNDTWITIDRDSSSFTFDGLEESTKYTVQVSAYNVNKHKTQLDGKAGSVDGLTDSSPKHGGMSPWAIVGIVVVLLVVVAVGGFIYKKKMVNNRGSADINHGDLL